jgi:hypothetical protein
MPTVVDWLPEPLKLLVYSVAIKLLVKSAHSEQRNELPVSDEHQCWAC